MRLPVNHNVMFAVSHKLIIFPFSFWCEDTIGHARDMVAELSVLVRCRYVVCTFSSNVRLERKIIVNCDLISVYHFYVLDLPSHIRAEAGI